VRDAILFANNKLDLLLIHYYLSRAE